MKRTIRASLIASAIALLPVVVATGAHAAGLGQVQVLSALGQPLQAEIPITATPQ